MKTGFIRAKKSLGQNFLTDENIARRIVREVSPQTDDILFEIGPGFGALTRILLESRPGYLIAVELDPRLVTELRSEIQSGNFKVIEADALKLDWEALLEESIQAWEQGGGQSSAGSPRCRVVANLPYYISTPILERLMRQGSKIFDMTLMLQNEVVDRMVSEPGNKDYGYLSVLVQYHCRVEKLFEVPPSAFTPAPKVYSAVVRLYPFRHPFHVADEEKFFALVRAAFAQRRKTILNNLKAAAPVLRFSQPPEVALLNVNINASRRAETLSMEDFSALYHRLFSR